MYMKIFEYGKGRGEGPVDYVTHTNSPKRERSPPQVLRGNPALTKELINSLSSDWKYTSGVLSWNHTDEVSVEQENELMDAFEEMAFAGLQADQYNVLWERHTHAGHHELHCVVPRVDLYGGKSFNPCPPNWQAHYDPMRDYYNVKHGWHRPDNPARRKLPTPEKLDDMKARLSARRKKLSNKTLAKFKEDLIEYFIFNLRYGFVKNREDIINLIHGLGFVLNRKGKDYITLFDQESGMKFRLKNGIFSEAWNIENTDLHKLIHDTFYEGLPKEEVLAKFKGKIEEITIKRSEYNKKRYAETNSKNWLELDAIKFEVLGSLNELSEQNNFEAINDRNSTIYTAGAQEYRANIPNEMGTIARGIDEADTANSRDEQKDKHIREQSAGLIEILRGLYANIQGLIRSLPELVKYSRRDRGEDLDNDDSDLRV